jgi:hypothetical protein
MAWGILQRKHSKQMSEQTCVFPRVCPGGWQGLPVGAALVCILTRFSRRTCPILLLSLVSDTRVPPFIVYRSSNQPVVAGMM